MKKEQFYELLGEIDENTVKAAEKPPVKRTGYKLAKYGIAAAACIGIFIGVGALYKHLNPPPSTDINIINADKNIDKMILVEAAYPEMPKYPDENDMNSYEEWSEASFKLRDQPEGYKDEFDTFFSNSTKTFLSDTGADNKVYSPLSLYMALGMSAEISDGNTRQQILDVLAQNDIDTLRSHSKSIWQANYMDDGMARCVLANSQAASLTVMMYAGTAMPEDRVDFVLDRPFIFEIMSETGLPLFVGIVNDPSQ